MLFILPLLLSFSGPSLAFAALESCLIPVVTLDRPFDAKCFTQSDARQNINIPERIINWGSNGLGGQPWHFIDVACNQFFIELMSKISSHKPHIKLTPHDLFHAHLIALGQSLVVVIHAKEYPADLDGIKNNYQLEAEQFFSSTKDFAERNFIYLSDTRQIYETKNHGDCAKFFADGPGQTLDEVQILAYLPKSKLLGDVNIFMPNTLRRLNYQFYPGMFNGYFMADLEAFHTAKSFEERLMSNIILGSWLDHHGQEPVLYFLTGR